MNFGDFYLNRVILELNYDEGHLYWDNCGATNLDILKKFPNWIWERTTTELSTFREKKKRIELLFNIQHIRFIQNEVDNLNQFKEAATEITPIILQHLQIDAFSRVGNRFIYVSSLDNIFLVYKTGCQKQMYSKPYICANLSKSSIDLI